jgi:threonine/homoserine/homoserine lactone efflux protein
VSGSPRGAQDQIHTLLDFVDLAALCVVIPSVCLTAWATAGAGLARVIDDPRKRAWIDGGIGGLLVASSVALLARLR